MKLLYIVLAIVFSIVLLQSFSSDNIIILRKLDSSIQRTDSLVHVTKHHVMYLDSAQVDNLNQIDSLSLVIETMAKQRQLIKPIVIHDTVFIEYDVD
jgi:hypothetical protein